MFVHRHLNKGREWAGKNVAVAAPRIAVVNGAHTIDVSGSHCERRLIGRATDGASKNYRCLGDYGAGAHEDDGNDESFGISGGNILIYVLMKF